MNNIGKMYQVKKWYWLLFPNKTLTSPSHAGSGGAGISAALVDATAAYYSKEYNCNVSYVFPNSIFCLLEKDGIYYKVITANGELGWFYLSDFYKDIIEEVNQ